MENLLKNCNNFAYDLKGAGEYIDEQVKDTIAAARARSRQDCGYPKNTFPAPGFEWLLAKS